MPRQQGAWQAHPHPHFQQQGCPEPPTQAGTTTPAARHWGQSGAKGVPSTLPYPPVPQHLEHFGRQEGQEITNLWPKPVKRLLPAVNLSHRVRVTHQDPIEPRTARALHSWHSHRSPASFPEQAASQWPGTRRNSPCIPQYPMAQGEFCCPAPAASRAAAPRFGVWQRYPGTGNGDSPGLARHSSRLDSLSRWEKLGCKAWTP